MSLFVPTKFIWRFGGSQVHLCGSFTRWVETVPMMPVEGQTGTFSVVVHLPTGYHQYKFIVDGEWRHDETQPFMPDPLGNVNNWLFVRKPEPSHTVGALHSQLQTHSHAQTSHAAAPPVSPPHDLAPVIPPINHQPSPPTPPSPYPPAAMEVAAGTPANASPADGVIPAIAAQVDEPVFTRRKIKEFLTHHTAYELIPESGKVVLLDIDLPLRQAFHALNEQGLASAPLYDCEGGCIAGVVSASDFIATLQRLRSMVSTSSNPMSEAEMDQHTIRGLREELAAEGRPPKPLVYVSPSDSLAQVVRTMYDNHCSMAPVLQPGPSGVEGEGSVDGSGPLALHTASLAGVLACLMRHFRASLASLPLLSQPLHSLPVGTWAPDSSVAVAAAAEERNGASPARAERRDTRRIAPIVSVRQDTPLTDALGLLLTAGMSCLPVVDENGALVDIYARSDITMLAKGNAYSRLQFEDVTVGQALVLAAEAAAAANPQLSPSPASASPQQRYSPNSSTTSLHEIVAAANRQRLHVCTSHDALRFVVERLALPGVRRVVVVHPDTRRVEGVISLSDVAAFMLL